MNAGRPLARRVSAAARDRVNFPWVVSRARLIQRVVHCISKVDLARLVTRVSFRKPLWATAMNIDQWLDALGLGQYARAFEENDIDPAMLPQLTDADLKELGIVSLGHRKRLLTAI